MIAARALRIFFRWGEIVTKRFFHLCCCITYPLLVCDVPYLCCSDNMYLNTSRSVELRKSIIHTFYALRNRYIRKDITYKRTYTRRDIHTKETYCGGVQARSRSGRRSVVSEAEMTGDAKSHELTKWQESVGLDLARGVFPSDVHL